MDSLLAKLSEQQAIYAKQQQPTPSPAPNVEKPKTEDTSSSPVLRTPASDSFTHVSRVSDHQAEETVRLEVAEMARLKQELNAAKSQIARQKEELDQTRVIKHTFDQAVGPLPEPVPSPKSEITDPSYNFIASRPQYKSAKGYNPAEDARSDNSEPPSSFSNIASVWSDAARPGYNANIKTEPVWSQSSGAPRPWGQRGPSNGLPPLMMPPPQPIQSRNYSVPISPLRGNGRGFSDFNQFNQGRNYNHGSRNSALFHRGNNWEPYTANNVPLEDINGNLTPSSAYPTMGMYTAAYQPRPIGTPLSPTATEFRTVGQAPVNPWNSAVSST